MKKTFLKNIKYSIIAIFSLALVFGLSTNKALAWNYNGTDIIYIVGDNTAPSVEAGPDISISLPTNSTSATGTASDPDGSISTTFWEFVSGPATASLGSQNNSTPSTITLSDMTVVGSYVFRFNAQDNDGAWGWDEMTVIVTDTNTPSGSISATNCTIAIGGSTCASSVSWSTSNLTASPTEVTHNNPATTSVSSATTGTNVSSNVNYGATTFFLYHNGSELAQASMNASCVSGGVWNGTTSKCEVDPTPTSTPSVTLTASPSVVFTNGSSTLSWISANVSSCTASAVPANASWTGSKSTSSSFPHESTGPLSATTTFTLSCTGVNGSASSSAIVNVVPDTGSGIIAELTANPGAPDKITLGDSSTLTWSCSPNATTSSGLGFNTGGALSGSVSVSPIVNTTYTLICSKTTAPTASASDQATVLLKRKFLFIEF
jgi:hypothetical protein